MIVRQPGENSRADSDSWWRRSTDGTSPFAAPGVNTLQEGTPGAGYSHCSARRTSSLPDTLAVAPPKDLTIPEHPGQMESGADEAYIQRKAVQQGISKGHDAVQVIFNIVILWTAKYIKLASFTWCCSLACCAWRHLIGKAAMHRQAWLRPLGL